MALSTLEFNILNCIPNDNIGLRGLEIAKKVNRDISFLYPTLDKLVKNNLIESYWGDHLEPNRNGYRTKYYRITKEGTLDFNNYLDTLIRVDCETSLSPI